MKYIISCGVFQPYIQQLVKDQTQVDFEIEYLEIKQHNQPDMLAQLLQSKIDAIQNIQEIILLYGLCGNAILSLRSRGIPIRVLRVHDCLSVLLGSKERFLTLFSNRPSQGWSCASYDQKEMMGLNMESDVFHDYVEMYGEENAHYIMEMMQTNQMGNAVYITFHLPEDDVCLQAYEHRNVEVIEGDLSMLKSVLEGNAKEETVVLHPKERIKAMYDLQTVLCVVNEKK